MQDEQIKKITAKVRKVAFLLKIYGSIKVYIYKVNIFKNQNGSGVLV